MVSLNRDSLSSKECVGPRRYFDSVWGFEVVTWLHFLLLHQLLLNQFRPNASTNKGENKVHVLYMFLSRF